jgi:hypothetical protein
LRIFARTAAGFDWRLPAPRDPHAKLTMDHKENARIQERHNLKVALATFALQLDAFEMRMSGARFAAGRMAGLRVPSPDRLQSSEGEYDWASLNSVGSKSGT